MYGLRMLKRRLLTPSGARSFSLRALKLEELDLENPNHRAIANCVEVVQNMASLDMFCMLQPAVYSSALCTLLQKYNQSPELLDGQIYFDKKDAGNTSITTRIPWVFAKVRIPEPRWFRLNCLFW